MFLFNQNEVVFDKILFLFNQNKFIYLKEIFFIIYFFPLQIRYFLLYEFFKNHNFTFRMLIE